MIYIKPFLDAASPVTLANLIHDIDEQIGITPDMRELRRLSGEKLVEKIGYHEAELFMQKIFDERKLSRMPPGAS